MRYLPFEKEQIENIMIYCNKHGKETPEDIVRAIVPNFFIGKFDSKEHKSLKREIKNDSDMFITTDSDGYYCIWQVCGKIMDYSDVIIPHLYKVRKVGIMIDI